MTPAIEKHRANILAALQSGPKRTTDIIALCGISGVYLGNIIKGLLKDGLISRQEVTTHRWRYYIGQTAPTPQETTKPKPKLKQQITHAVPVRQIEVPRFAEYSRNTQAAPPMMKITLPAEPWL